MTKKNLLPKEYKFTMPLYLQLGKGSACKKYHLNFNNCRGWFFNIYNSLKIKYKTIAEEQLKGVKIKTPIELTFILWRGDLKKVDRANILSIHEKFFCDALTEWGCIFDDNDVYILKTTYYTGGYEKGLGRVDIIVREV